ncbi:hypothetical protein L2D08_05875 [Domibacillus sp. PGB-M46]|uniref:hypothetical protein n=1 Tax=Domibacillus sp. PGB-M46 TaxID=2910255 RepID=UPI001F55B44B|nr:hypothetical protein [Domibacillus sp. PGB-M46]MCI2253889.1 hypothetical protein [Domibacillus sp. PGB-M46]
MTGYGDKSGNELLDRTFGEINHDLNVTLKPSYVLKPLHTKRVFSLVKKKRKTQAQETLSVEKAREAVTRMKKLENLSKHTLESGQKLFNDLECRFSNRKLVSNFTIADARRLQLEHWICLNSLSLKQRNLILSISF